MKRMMVIGLGLVLGGALVGSTPAVAQPPDRLTITLSCDRGVSATALVTFAETGDVGISCGTAANRVRQVVALGNGVTEVNVMWAEVVRDGSPVTCADETAVPTPARIDCPADGLGARLVVR